METQCPALLWSPGKLLLLLQDQFLQEETKTTVPLLFPFQIVSNCFEFPQGGGEGMARNGCEGEGHMLNGWACLRDENATPLAGRQNVTPQVAAAQTPLTRI